MVVSKVVSYKGKGCYWQTLNSSRQCWERAELIIWRACCVRMSTQHNTLPLQLPLLTVHCKCMSWEQLKGCWNQNSEGLCCYSLRRKRSDAKWMGKHLWTKHDHTNESCKATKANLSCAEEAFRKYISHNNLRRPHKLQKEELKEDLMSLPCNFLGSFLPFLFFFSVSWFEGDLWKFIVIPKPQPLNEITASSGWLCET